MSQIIIQYFQFSMDIIVQLKNYIEVFQPILWVWKANQMLRCKGQVFHVMKGSMKYSEEGIELLRHLPFTKCLILLSQTRIVWYSNLNILSQIRLGPDIPLFKSSEQERGL